jgi:hypothetical protein
MRALVLVREPDRPRSEVGLLDALASDANFTLVRVEPPDFSRIGALGNEAGADAVVVSVKYRDLLAAPDLDWRGYTGLRVMLEHDAWLNFALLSLAHKGTYPSTFRRHGFDLLVASGADVAKRLREQGVAAAWVPKGYDDRVFYDEGRARAGVSTYGTSYPSRQAMARHLKRRGIRTAQLQVPYLELGHELNRYFGCIVCNMDGRYPAGLPGKVVRRLAPGAFVRPRPGFEPMIKNFEAAAAGCAVFADSITELETLGFLDGDTIITYRTFGELVSRLRDYIDRPEALRTIGERAARLCAERHTWAHRVPQLARVLEDALGSH